MLKQQDKFGRTPLHYVAFCSNPVVVSLSICKTLDPAQIRFLAKIKDVGGNTFLHVLAQYGHIDVEILNILQRQGLSLHEICSMKNNRNKIVLHYAAEKCSLIFLSFLMEECKEGDLIAKDADGNTPLHTVLERCINNDLLIARRVLSKLEEIISKSPCILEAKDGEGTTIRGLMAKAKASCFE